MDPNASSVGVDMHVNKDMQHVGCDALKHVIRHHCETACYAVSPLTFDLAHIPLSTLPAFKNKQQSSNHSECPKGLDIFRNKEGGREGGRRGREFGLPRAAASLQNTPPL